MKYPMVLISLLIFSVTLAAQGNYQFRRDEKPLDPIFPQPILLHYSSDVADVSQLGLGKVQTAWRNRGEGMMGNPAFLAHRENRIDAFSIQTAFPPTTWEAAWFLEDHMDEFIDAASMVQILDGAEAFFDPEAAPQDRWTALREIQDGLSFTVDLMNEVTGSSEAPQKHGFSVLPRLGAQFGHWGVSVYGYGQANFMVRQSPTLEALANVEVPENLKDTKEATRSILQILAILSAGLIKDKRSFSQEVFPVAFYLSYMDIVGSIGYGNHVWKGINAGAVFKIINRRFSLNRIPVVQYDEIIENAFSDLNQSKTGITFDAGLQTRLPFGTDVGLCFKNILPFQTLNDEISMDFVKHTVEYDKNINGEIQVEDGDTLMVRYKCPVTLTLPFELKLPFCANFGIHHAFSRQWSAGLDWIDVFENDTRYKSTTGRIRLGSQYEQPIWRNKLALAGRLGFGDEHLCGGLGISIYNKVLIDGAYAWDSIIECYAYHAQLRVVL
ncbi:hypothetical protein JW835_11490 [bacterium]|nr:hypothetical protein [bacterium]